MFILHRIFFVLVFVFFASPVLSQYSYREIIHLPWGSFDTEIGFRKAPGGQFGPMSFKVKNDSIFVLDTQNQSIKIFHNNLLLKKTGFQIPAADDFIWKNSNNYFLLSENLVYEFIDQKMVQTFSPNSQRDIISLLIADKNDNIFAVINESNSINLEESVRSSLKKGAASFHQSFVQIEKEDWRTINVQVDPNNSFQIISAKPDLGSARFLGSTPDEKLFIYIEKIKQQIPLQVDREVHLYDKNGNLNARFSIPTHAHTYIFKELYIDENGNLFHMISAVDGVHIIGWFFDGVHSEKTAIFEYPDRFQKYYHYNMFDQNSSLKKSQDSKLKKKDNISSTLDFPSVTRSEALAIGETYEQHIWTASPQNLTNGRIIDSNGIDVETPRWIQIGTNQKVPYQWGGFWTLPGFDQGLLDGKYAGDFATTGVSSFCVGVDCSGFVSRCWKLLSHYSTRMMDDYIAAPHSSWNQLKPADAVHKPGHVRLFVDFNPNGSLLTVEASGRDWRVSYRSYYLSDLSEYLPRYYIFMEGMPGSITKPELTSICFSDSLELKWQLPDSASISGFHLYAGVNNENWTLFADEQVLKPDNNSRQIELYEQEPIFFKMMSVSAIDDSSESYPTDTYGYLNKGSQEKILIVDGFDRTTGSYAFSYHPFAMTMGKALANFAYSFETACNEAIIDSSIRLENYDAVFWLLGDESTKDETFSDKEQNLVKKYLQEGGKIFITGSEVGWDLDYKGSSSDKSFFHNFLKTSYHQDDSESYSVNGVQGTVFAGLTLHYDDGTKGIYEEDWPDAFQPVNGSISALKYENGLVAATAFSGIVPDGTKSAQIFLLGFPFETIYGESERVNLLERVLQFFDMTTTLVTEQTTQNPKEFTLSENYPNPFNPGTFIHYRLFENEKVELKIYDILGQLVRILVDEEQKEGDYEIYWDGLDENRNSVSSGMYVYKIQMNSISKSKKMMLLK
jgi:cell wall-associated NlpC family hydrolase